MPDVTILSPSYPAYDREVIWPYPTFQVGQACGTAFPLPTYQARDTLPNQYGTTQIAALQTANSVAGGGVHNIVNAGNSGQDIGPVARTTANAGGNRRYGFAGLASRPVELGTDLVGGVALPSIDRVWWLRIYLSAQTNPPSTNTRILLVPFNDATAGPETPDQAVGPGNAGGFGIGGDGAGQWRYVSYNRTGVNLLYEAQALPAHTLADYNLFEVVMVNSQPGIDCQFSFFWNGIAQFSRSFAGGLLEPKAGQEWGFRPVVQAVGDGGLTRDLNYKFHLREGRFTNTGVEIQG